MRLARALCTAPTLIHTAPGATLSISGRCASLVVKTNSETDFAHASATVAGAPCELARAGALASDANGDISLAASNADHTVVELLSPPEGVPVGERVTFEGHPGEPLPPNQVAKKKVWEAVQPDLSTDGKCVALYKDLPFTVANGTCTVATIKNGGIK